MIAKSDMAAMKNPVSCLNNLQKEGYTEDFKIVDSSMQAIHHEKIYAPSQVHVVDFYRFEGASDPADNSILYAIETDDGVKGTLMDAYGPYADENVTEFMEKVLDVAKKT